MYITAVIKQENSMARFKEYNYNQMRLLPISLSKQLQPGTLEHTIYELVENKIDMSIFNENYKNDETGAKAYSPKLLLKVILLAYSRGITGSRRIEQACKENVTFMAVACGLEPDHSTINAFVTSMKPHILELFRNILLICDGLELLSGTHFSLDGCKLPSNASKEWSGTFKALKKKKGKLEQKLIQLLHQHEQTDKKDQQEQLSGGSKTKKQIRQIDYQLKKLNEFLESNEPKEGKSRKEIQSNVTDNESAKMPTSHGVIQGYNAQAMVDSKNQIIVHAEAMSNGQDAANLEPMLTGTKENLQEIGKPEDVLSGTALTADSSYHSKENVEICEQANIDAYIPDVNFRKRDNRFENQDRFRDGVNKPPKRKESFEKYDIKDFRYDKEQDHYICPQGNVLKRKAANQVQKGSIFHQYKAERECIDCIEKDRCMARKDSRYRYLSVRVGKTKEKNASQKMQDKIDTAQGRLIYSKRLGMVEPVFGNIRSQKRLDRFTYRGKWKVNIQWLLYCMVHNIEKIAHAAPL